MVVDEQLVKEIERQGYSRPHAERMADIMTPTPNGQPPPKAREVTEVPPDSKDVRRWAKARGMKLADRGRPSKEVVAAYQEAHR